LLLFQYIYPYIKILGIYNSMPRNFFDDCELKRLDNGRIIWLINVKGDGNCGYHAWLSAVVNGENMNHIKLELFREGILTDADRKYISNKKFRSTEDHGAKLRHYLHNKTLNRPNTDNGRYRLSRGTFVSMRERIQKGDIYNGGQLGLGWMENDELQILSNIFKLNIFVQNDRRTNYHNNRIHDLSLNQTGDYNNAPKIFIYTSGMHFQVIDSVKSKLHNVNPQTNMRVSNNGHQVVNKKISTRKYKKIIDHNEQWEEVVNRGPSGDVILFYNKTTGNWILPENNLKSKSKSKKSTKHEKMFRCKSCTFDYKPKQEGNRCPMCRTSKNGTPADTTTESDRETSALLYAESIQTGTKNINVSPEVTTSARTAINMVKYFKQKHTVQSAKKAKKALHNFSKKTNSLQSNLRKINEMERKERKNIKKQVEDNARLARRLRREERRSPSTRSKSKSVSRKRKSPSVSRRKSPSVRKNKSKSKSKSPNNNSASTVQTNSLKSNLRKIKEQQIREQQIREQQIRENEKFARELRNEQSNHNSPNQQQNNSPNQQQNNSPNQQQNNSPNQQQNNSSKSNRQKQMNSNEALARALEGMSNVA
jgi:hypothetical protein